MVRLGTKWLSMTSKWIQSAPAARTRVTSSPRRAKSAERIDGAIRYMTRAFRELCFRASVLPCCRASVLASARRQQGRAGSASLAALTLRAVGDVPVQRVADVAALALLPDEAEARLPRGAVDDEAHDDRLHAARGVERHQADVVLRKGPAAALQLEQHAGGILELEHRHAEHLPVGVARVRVVGVLDAPGVAAREAVVDLQRDLGIGELGEEAELALGDAVHGVGHHGACSP